MQRQQCPPRERNPNKNLGKEIEKKAYIYIFLDLVPNATGIYVVGLYDLVFRAFNTAISKWLFIPYKNKVCATFFYRNIV